MRMQKKWNIETKGFFEKLKFENFAFWMKFLSGRDLALADTFTQFNTLIARYLCMVMRCIFLKAKFFSIMKEKYFFKRVIINVPENSLFLLEILSCNFEKFQGVKVDVITCFDWNWHLIFGIELIQILNINICSKGIKQLFRITVTK